MLRLLMCLFGLHGATEIDYTVDDEEIKVCRDCMKEVQAIRNKVWKLPFVGNSK